MFLLPKNLKMIPFSPAVPTRLDLVMIVGFFFQGGIRAPRILVANTHLTVAHAENGFLMPQGVTCNERNVCGLLEHFRDEHSQKVV